MKIRNLLTTMTLTAVLLLAAGKSWGQELPVNWNGDTDIDVFKESVNPHGDSFCAKIDVKTGNQANCDFTNDIEINVSEGNSYTLKFWYKTSSHVKGRGVLIWTGAAITYTNEYTLADASTWTEFVSSGTIPVGVTGVKVGIRFYDQSGFIAPETQYIDDVTFESPTGNVLTVTNGDIESWPADSQPPIATFDPANGATNVQVNVHPTITFDEPIRNIDNSEITDANVASLLTFKETDETGTDVSFTAIISADKKLITITPGANLKFSQLYYLAIAPVEDVSDNATTTQSITFTTRAASTDATVSSLVYTVDNTAETITNVPSSETLATFEGNITPAAGATFDTYEADGTTVATVLATDYKLICTAEDGVTKKTYTVTLNTEPSHEANITAYSINGVDGVINSGGHTISVTLPYGTNVTALVATFTLSANATAKVGGVVQVSGTTANDFTSPVTYTVTAEDGSTTQDWVVTVTVTPASSAKDITSFTISGQVSSTIDAVAGTVAVVMPYGTNLTSLTPTIEVSQFATIDPASGVAQDFTNPVVYTVTAQDNSTKTWTVTVTVQPASNDATVSSTVYTVNNVDGTITNVPYNETLATFKSNITPATGATFEVYQSDGTTVATDLQTGYNLICTAQDGTTTKTYTITLNTPPATPIVYEPFDYTVGSALQGQGGWTGLNTGDDLLIASGNLTYPDLAPSAGNKLSFAGAGIDAYKEFSAIGYTSGKVYYSFILKVTDLTAATQAEGGYFIGFAYDNTTFGATVWTKRVDDNSYQIGINSRTTAANTQFTTGSYSKDAEVFIVASYEVVDGTGNDVAKIWINPASQDFGAATEPASTLSITNTGGTDLTSIKRVFIRQDSDAETPAIELDELRVGDTWAQVTPAGALSNDATVSSLVYTVDNTAGTITNVPQTETLANFKANITPAAGATFEVYQSDGTTVATDLQTGYKLICTAEDGVTKKTYTITLNTEPSHQANITAYSINGVDGVINSGDHTISVTLPYGTNVTALVATFTLSANATAKVGGVDQVSGTTANDFSSPVTYTVTAEDGSTTQDWVVTVTVTPASSAKDITSFTISGQVSSTIDAVAGTVAVVMPYGTNVTSLTPTITVSAGATINPASGVAQDFTNPVTYTVTAQDASTKAWTVTVTVQQVDVVTIHDIQFSEATPAVSPYKGQQVTTKGLVTGMKYSATYSNYSFFMQDGVGAWNGVYVYACTFAVAVGDSVQLTATVDEYNTLTELKNVTALTVINSGNQAPAPAEVSVTTAASEPYEGVLVKVTNAECTAAPDSYGAWTVSDGTTPILVDDLYFAYTPTVGEHYNVTGIVDYAYSAWRMYPRETADVSLWNYTPANPFATFSAYPNPFTDVIRFSGSEVNRVTIFSVIGQVVLDQQVNGAELVDTRNLEKGIYLVRFTNNQGKSTTRKLVKQ